MKPKHAYQVMQQFWSWKKIRKPTDYIVKNFKNNYDFQVLLDGLSKLINHDKYAIRKIWGNMFPKSIYNLLSSKLELYENNSFKSEIKWVIIQIILFRKEIRKFIHYRDKITNCILLGEYESAKELLDNCKKEIGISIWYYEILFLIYSLTGEEDKIYKILNTINDISKINKKDNQRKTGVDNKICIVPLIIHLLHLRSSSSLVTTFDNELERYTKRNEKVFQKELLNYLKFRVNFFSELDKIDYEGLLYFEAPNSLVDRYRSFYYLLLAVFLKNKDKRIEVSNYAIRIYKRTKDPQLLSLIAYKSSNELPNDYFKHDFLDILNNYYSKQYNKVQEECREYVKTDACNLNNLRLYVQSLINENKAYSNIHTNSNSLVNKITSHIYSILTEQDSKKSLASLTYLTKRLYGTIISAGLHSFIGEQMSNEKRPLQVYSLCTSYDPIYSRIWETAKEENWNSLSIRYIEKGYEHDLSGITLDYYLSLYKETQPPEIIATYRKVRDKAISYFKHGQFEECIIASNDLLNSYSNSIAICQVATEYTFMSYDALGRYMEAISFYVNQYIKHPSIPNKVKLKDFVQKLRDHQYHDLNIDLDLQIFSLLNVEEHEQKAFLLERFMRYLGVDDVNGLIEELKDEENSDKLELFLYLLVDSEVFTYTRMTQSPVMMLEEKQIIAKYLCTINSVHNNDYQELYEEISNEINILQDNSSYSCDRIFVDKDYLVNKELNVFNDLYNQLFETAKIAETVPNFSLVALEKNLILPDDPNSSIKEIYTTNNPYFDIAVQLFDLISEKYLYSKVGLNTFLSTRIRHHFLESELRSMFSNYHLVSLDVKKIPIDYWCRKFGLDNIVKNEILKYLDDFSFQLQNCICNFINNELQIRIDDKGRGMIDFRKVNEIKSGLVLRAFNSTSNYKDFCYAFLHDLELITESSLVKIRSYVKNDFHNQIIGIIDAFNNQMATYKDYNFYEEMTKSISNSKNKLIEEIEIIENWFAFETPTTKDFVLSRLIESIWTSTAKIYRYNYTNFDISSAEITMQAKFNHFITDILFILFNNIFTHGDIKDKDSVSLSSCRNGNNIILTFENYTTVPDEKLNKILKENKSSNEVQSEGGSGFAKVMNIIQNELYGNNDDFEPYAYNGKCIVKLVLHLDKLESVK